MTRLPDFHRTGLKVDIRQHDGKIMLRLHFLENQFIEHFDRGIQRS